MSAWVLLLLVACFPNIPPDYGLIGCGGTFTCEGGKVCLQQSFAPDCTAHSDTDGACPDGTTEAMCGGDGHPCCCAPPPDMTFTCIDAGTCGDVPTCDCLGEVCPRGKECIGVGAEASGVFLCEEPPVP